MKQAAHLRHQEAHRKAARLVGHARQEAKRRADEALALDLEAAEQAAYGARRARMHASFDAAPIDPEHGSSGPGGGW
jgi:hypothetical protein